MKRCVIIDDEKNAGEVLFKLINRYYSSRLSVLDIATSVKEGVKVINEKHPDIVFLDIEMPEESGFKLFDYYDNIPFKVIFTTAYEDYAIKAIKYAALDYLLKPINQVELGDAILRIEKEDKYNAQTSMNIDALIHNLNIDSDSYTKIAFPTNEGMEMIKLRNIVYCCAEINYTKIHTISGEVIIVSKTLKKVAEMFPENLFFRIHKSYLVNKNYIKRYAKTGTPTIYLETGEALPVSHRNCENLLKEL